MHRRTSLRSAALAGTIALALAGCGSDDDGGAGSGAGGKPAGGGQLNIYSSLPLQGETRAQSEDVLRGEQLALKQAGGKAGKFSVKLISLDDATTQAGKWDPGKVSENARKVIADPHAVAYLGELNSGASALSIPLLNEGGVLQVSPANTSAGLTRKEGADAGEPEKYYPSGVRNFGRVLPADHIQAAAVVTYMKDRGVKQIYIAHDKEVYGKGLSDQVAAKAEEEGVKVLGEEGIDVKAANFRALGAKVKSSGADGFFFGGQTSNRAVQVIKDVGASTDDVQLFGPDGVAEEAFAAKLGSEIEARTHVTSPVLDPASYPPAAQRFFADFRKAYGHDAEPYSIYGYESMNAVLTAIKSAGEQGDDRAAVVKGFFGIRNRESVLGTYSIDENGDTTLATYGGYGIKGGKLVFDEAIGADAQG